MVQWGQKVSTLSQVTACCLTASSRYPNQCCLINGVPWHPYDTYSTVSAQNINSWNKFEKYTCKSFSSSPRGQWVQQVSYEFQYHWSRWCNVAVFLALNIWANLADFIIYFFRQQNIKMIKTQHRNIWINLNAGVGAGVILPLITNYSKKYQKCIIYSICHTSM